jgi:hypothetical protein
MGRLALCTVVGLHKYLCDRLMYINIQYEPVADLMFSGHYAEVHFGAEIIFATVKIFLQNFIGKYVSTFTGKGEDRKRVDFAQME